MSTIQTIDFNVDLLRALLWQYEGATGLQGVLRSKQAWYDERHTAFWQSWYDNVFNLRTADEFGCAVWGIILGIQLTVDQPGTGAREVFGFGANNLNFGNANFGRDSAGAASLTLEQQRAVLLLRCYQIVSDGSVPHTNAALQDVFGMGYVLDSYDMTASYVFPSILTSQMRMVLEAYDLLPRPAGVETEILIDPGNWFGFAPVYANFENGTFGA